MTRGDWIVTALLCAPAAIGWAWESVKEWRR